MQQKHWINCKKHKESICMEHCFNECKYRDKEKHHCTYVPIEIKRTSNE